MWICHQKPRALDTPPPPCYSEGLSLLCSEKHKACTQTTMILYANHTQKKKNSTRSFGRPPSILIQKLYPQKRKRVLSLLNKPCTGASQKTNLPPSHALYYTMINNKRKTFANNREKWGTGLSPTATLRLLTANVFQRIDQGGIYRIVLRR